MWGRILCFVLRQSFVLFFSVPIYKGLGLRLSEKMSVWSTYPFPTTRTTYHFKVTFLPPPPLWNRSLTGVLVLYNGRQEPLFNIHSHVKKKETLWRNVLYFPWIRLLSLSLLWVRLQGPRDGLGFTSFMEWTPSFSGHVCPYPQWKKDLPSRCYGVVLQNLLCDKFYRTR